LTDTAAHLLERRQPEKWGRPEWPIRQQELRRQLIEDVDDWDDESAEDDEPWGDESSEDAEVELFIFMLLNAACTAWSGRPV
jgi:hypothetical protein